MVARNFLVRGKNLKENGERYFFSADAGNGWYWDATSAIPYLSRGSIIALPYGAHYFDSGLGLTSKFYIPQTI